ncbi:phage portal protein [Terribacillus saccharophilus]|uniref:phage portal protein n=1 Tax=Terribacillus saccharophilus TaxID=361277 RepID=UPI000BA61C83|nr:phage portal protein [Terribacillus saccharophilus]PAF18601.1 phage portal protein [Terribacillus saccharophilus]
MAQQQMKARVIKADAPTQTTRQMYDDPFIDIYENGDILQPPYNLKELKGIGEYSTILQQCIEAYKINILGFGFEPRYLFDYNAQDTSSERKKKADEEWTQLTEFMRYLHFDEEAETVLGYALEDREKMGNGYVEVLRDGTNKPAGIEYADGQYMRVCKKTVPDLVPYSIVRNGKLIVIERWRSFRRYVQMINGKKVFFKEYGDTRIMDSRTGKFDDNTPENLRATEIIHFKIGSGSYGVPRWIGHIVNIYGTRKAQELNYLYFKQGRHVPAAIIVENGMLSADSEKQLQEYMNGIEGSDNAHKFLLLEAEGIEVENTTDTGYEQTSMTPVKVQIKSLAEILQQDALFLEYDKQSRDKLRSAFRLPPLYTGESQDYNKSTSETARQITEEQVFQPERKLITGTLNTRFLRDLEIFNVELTLKGPNFGDAAETAKALYPLISAGAAAPNDLRDLLGKLIGKELEMLPEEYNVPVQVLLRELTGANGASPIFKARDGQAGTEIVSVLKDVRDVLEELQTHG